MRVFKKRPKVPSEGIPGFRPMAYREVWEWGFYEGVETACLYLSNNGLSAPHIESFRNQMLISRKKIGEVTFGDTLYGKEKETYT